LPERIDRSGARGYIFVDINGRDLGGYVAEAQRAVAELVELPPGYSVAWSGQFEYLERAEARMKIVVPVTLLIASCCSTSTSRH
jgi:Cu(I)/Ag(I) efflux system membrane protein CusA/SilA